MTIVSPVQSILSLPEILFSLPLVVGLPVPVCLGVLCAAAGE